MKNHILKTISLCLCFIMLLSLPSFARDICDVDGDGNVTAADARAALRASVNLQQLSLQEFTAADFDRDSKITASDARAILRISVGLNPTGEMTEYDILRGSSLNIKARLYEKGTWTPMEMAFTPKTTYMFMQDGSLQMGLLIDTENVYMINEEEKAVVTMSYDDAKALGFPVEDIKAGESIFRQLPPLYKADKVYEKNVWGKNCSVYVFLFSNGKTEIVMNGSKLLKMDEYDKGGTLVTSTQFELISSDIPPARRGDFSGYTVG